jgi:hypothetical protein
MDSNANRQQPACSAAIRICGNCKHLIANHSAHWCLAYIGDSPTAELRKLKHGQTNDCDDFESKFPVNDSESSVVELQIQPRISDNDHHQVVSIGGKFPIRFVGFIGRFMDSRIHVQRCGRCHEENYVLAVSSGKCCWCGWDANDQEQTKVIKDCR